MCLARAMGADFGLKRFDGSNNGGGSRDASARGMDINSNRFMRGLFFKQEKILDNFRCYLVVYGKAERDNAVFEKFVVQLSARFTHTRCQTTEAIIATAMREQGEASIMVCCRLSY